MNTFIKPFLIEVLHIIEDAAKSDACDIEHAVSSETLCSMCKQINNTTRRCVCSGSCYVHTDTAPRRILR